VSLQWVRLDTSFPFNPKVLGLLGASGGHRAAAVYLFGLSYAGMHGTDGFLPAQALGVFHGRGGDAELLVDHDLWLPVSGGWQIHGWADKQQSTEETRRRRQRAQDAAMVRWHGKRQGLG